MIGHATRCTYTGGRTLGEALVTETFSGGSAPLTPVTALSVLKLLCGFCLQCELAMVL